MEYLIHKPVSDSKEEDVVNEGDDDIYKYEMLHRSKPYCIDIFEKGGNPQ